MTDAESMRKVMNLLAQALLECRDNKLRACIDDIYEESRSKLKELVKVGKVSHEQTS